MSRSPSIYVVAIVKLDKEPTENFLIELEENSDYQTAWEYISYEVFGEEISEENTLIIWTYATGDWGFFEISKLEEEYANLREFVAEKFNGCESNTMCSVTYS